jgi:hypothetical protein
VGYVGLLALAPGRFRVFVSVRTALYDLRHLVAEAGAYVFEGGLATLVLGGVVEQRGHYFVLLPFVLADDCRHREQVG